MKLELLRVGQFNLYDGEIDELKRKIHEKSEQVRNKKEEFIHHYKKNRSNKSVLADSTLKEDKQQEDPELIELKRQYLQMGKKIDILKLKKSSLLKSIPNLLEYRKTLEKLKQKY